MKPSVRATALGAGGGLIGVAGTLIMTAGDKLDSGDLTKVLLGLIGGGVLLGITWLVTRAVAKRRDPMPLPDDLR